METWHGNPQRADHSLDAFVPAFLRRRIAQGPTACLQPTLERFDATIMVTDLSGFSSMAEGFAGRGPRGAEDLKDVLNFYCGHLADAIERHGGEVIRFAGDAALALWSAGEGRLADSVCLAAQCARAIQQTLKATEPLHGVRLPLRVGLGAGQVVSATVGGVEGRWDLLLAGDALTQAIGAVSVAAPEDVALSSGAWAEIATCATGRRVGSTVMRLETLLARSTASIRPAMPPCDEALLRAYVTRSVQARFDARQTDWLAEFRRATALFVRLDTVTYDAADSLVHLQRAVVAVQSAIYRYGGSILQLVVDDKGTVVVCAWGLALHAHSDDQVRSLRAALELRADLRDAGIRASFGLATGDVFAGVLGTVHRCEYAIVGDIVNVAARLMEMSAGDILCDAASFDPASARIAFEALPAMRVKGRDRPVDVYRPIELTNEGGEMVGRSEERRLLRSRLEALARENIGGVVILEGESGIGKSRLVADVIESAVTKGIRTMLATGDPIERSSSNHVWAVLLGNLLGLDCVAGAAASERRVMELLAPNERLLPFASLLNPVLRLAFPETESSQTATPRGRALLTRELLVHLFKCAVGDRATLLIIEDAHWLDPASWELAELLARELPDVLMFIVMLVMGREDQPHALAQLIGGKRALVLHLDALTPDQGRVLICRRMRARVLSEPVARLIGERAEGHPFFIEELLYSLRDRGLIHVTQGICRLSADAEAQTSVELPNTVQVAVAGRIDKLSMDRQLTVKVASVFGRMFRLTGLRTIYPIEIDMEELQSHVGALIEHRLVQMAPTQPESYEFKHAITQEVAYGLLPYQLRRQLHASVATWYERQYGERDASYYPLLAHHWRGAEQPTRAMFYLEKAGEQALRRHANEEALRFYREAIELDEGRIEASAPEAAIALGRRHIISARDAARMTWACRLGDASTNLSHWDQGKRHFKNALSLVGAPLPTSDHDFSFGVARAVAVQGGRRLGLLPFRRPTNRAAALLHDAVGAYQRLGSICYQDGDALASLYALVKALNLAESLGPSPQFAFVCADVSNVLGLVPLRSASRLYQRIAFQIAGNLDDRVMAARIRARAAIYRLGVGDWEACADLETAMALFEEIGDSYLWEESAAIRARGGQLRGEFELAARLGADVRIRAAANRSIPHEIWGIAAEVWARLYLGHHQFVLEGAQAGLHLLSSAPSGDQIATLDFLGAAALAHIERGEVGRAHHTTARLMEAIARTSRVGYFAALGISAALETCLTVWELDGSSSRGTEASRRVRHLLGTLNRYARVSPPARARARLWRGCAEWLEGRPARAHRSWDACLRESERFALGYESARAHYEIGRRLQDADQRTNHLAHAEREFGRMQAITDQRRATMALAHPAGAQPLLW